MDELERFIQAQDVEPTEKVEDVRFDIQHDANSYADALEEIRKGRKYGHWIWYVFPQLKGLRHSYKSNYYGIRDISEAIAYLNHPILGRRLREITQTLLNLPEGKTARQILGSTDAQKVKASMTLFYIASKEPLFLDVINRYYEGDMDEKTIEVLKV